MAGFGTTKLSLNARKQKKTTYSRSVHLLISLILVSNVPKTKNKNSTKRVV